ncbi:MAG: ATP-binding response regulator [Candidatus Binatia bacterium]
MTHSTANILVVDDDDKSLLAMEALLAGPGRNIVTARSGADALRELMRQEFAVMLLDVRMPEMDGFETATLIRQRERLRHLPIIFLSAVDTMDADVYRGVVSGAVDYLFKPVVPQVLKAKVAVFVDLFRMHEQIKQQALEQGEARFQLAVEASPNAMIMIATDGQIVLANAQAEQLFGYTREEMFRQSIDTLVPERFREKHAGLRAGFFSYPKSRPMGAGLDLFGMRKDGSEVSVEIGLNPIQINDVTFVLVSIIDITNRKRTEQALRESEQKLRKQADELEQQLIASGRLVSVGELSASMAHEFNNPLGIVLGFTQGLLAEMDPADPNYRPLQIISEETKRCEKMVRDLLEFGRPKSTDFISTDVEEVIAKTLEMISLRLYNQNIEAIKEIAPDLSRIDADPQQLQQVLVNLSLNAVDAMPAGGKLTLSAKQNSSGQMTITVADTGFGIDAVTLAKIFQPFFTAKKWRGMGLGLPICARIIKSHGGRIDVESQPGQGTTFTIHLPLKQP